MKMVPIPKKIDIDTKTNTYGKFIISPYQSGFGSTVGNSLRRVLLSSMSGIAIFSIRIVGVKHEFSTIENVVEDMSEVILNLKKIIFVSDDILNESLTIHLFKKNFKGDIIANDINLKGTNIKILNPSSYICTTGELIDFEMEIDIIQGVGYSLSEKNKILYQQKEGSISIDSLFSPVRRVKYYIGTARFGEETEMDKLIIEIWTDGRIDPYDAFKKAANILLDYFSPLTGKDRIIDPETLIDTKDKHLFKIFIRSIETLDLSVRSKNCLDNENISTIGELCTIPISKMLKYKNFGKKSLEEINIKLEKLELKLGMIYNESLTEALKLQVKQNSNKND